MIFHYFILIFLLNFVFSVRQSDFGSGFGLFPPNSEWKSLIKEVQAQDIRETVEIYMAPFKEFQTAARDRSIKPEKLKLAFVTALTLLQESVRNFSISAEELHSAKVDTDPFLLMPSAAFKSKKAEDLDQVFTVDSLEAFSRLRLKHLIGTLNTSYLTFLMRKNAYENTLKEWNVVASRLPKCQYRPLMARNLDLNYIEHMTEVYLNIIRLRSKEIKS